ncbi:MAG: hypothetical protein AB1540_12585 [Bdellovibrionota bacterium]
MPGLLSQYALSGFQITGTAIEPGVLVGILNGALVRYESESKTWSKFSNSAEFVSVESSAEARILAASRDGRVFQLSRSGEPEEITARGLEQYLVSDSILKLKTNYDPTLSGSRPLHYGMMVGQPDSSTDRRLILVENEKIEALSLSKYTSNKIIDFITDGSVIWILAESSNAGFIEIGRIDKADGFSYRSRERQIGQGETALKEGAASLIALRNGTLYAKLGEHFGSMEFLSEKKTFSISIEAEEQFSSQLRRHGIPVGASSNLSVIQPRLSDWNAKRNQRFDIRLRNDFVHQSGTIDMKEAELRRKLMQRHEPKAKTERASSVSASLAPGDATCTSVNRGASWKPGARRIDSAIRGSVDNIDRGGSGCEHLLEPVPTSRYYPAVKPCQE